MARRSRRPRRPSSREPENGILCGICICLSQNSREQRLMLCSLVWSIFMAGSDGDRVLHRKHSPLTDSGVLAHYSSGVPPHPVRRAAPKRNGRPMVVICACPQSLVLGCWPKLAVKRPCEPAFSARIGSMCVTLLVILPATSAIFRLPGSLRGYPLALWGGELAITTDEHPFAHLVPSRLQRRGRGCRLAQSHV